MDEMDSLRAMVEQTVRQTAERRALLDSMLVETRASFAADADTAVALRMHWDAEKLAEHLGREGVREDQLARQLVAMSKIAWRKHAWLQYSLICLVIGAVCLLLAA